MAQALRNPLGLSATGVAIVSAAILATAPSISAAPAETQVQTAEGTLAGAWLPGYRLFEGIPMRSRRRELALATAAGAASLDRRPRRPAAGRRVRAAGDLLAPRIAGELA
jgi:hypothetical protein